MGKSYMYKVQADLFPHCFLDRLNRYRVCVWLNVIGLGIALKETIHFQISTKHRFNTIT